MLIKKPYSNVSSQEQLWHERMGHLNYPTLNVMCKLNMVKGLPKINVDKCLCEACLLGKHHKEKIEKGKAWRAR